MRIQNDSLLFHTSNRTAFLLGGWPEGAQVCEQSPLQGNRGKGEGGGEEGGGERVGGEAGSRRGRGEGERGRVGRIKEIALEGGKEGGGGGRGLVSGYVFYSWSH